MLYWIYDIRYWIFDIWHLILYIEYWLVASGY